MSIASIECDRCGSAIRPPDRTLLHVAAGPLRARHAALDLCPDCAWGLAQWVERPAHEKAPRPALATGRGAPQAHPYAGIVAPLARR